MSEKARAAASLAGTAREAPNHTARAALNAREVRLESNRPECQKKMRDTPRDKQVRYFYFIFRLTAVADRLFTLSSVLLLSSVLGKLYS